MVSKNNEPQEEAESIEIFDTDIYECIKENFEPVEDKPGYVWLSKRNFNIIKIETLAESLKEGWTRQSAYFISLCRK